MLPFLLIGVLLCHLLAAAIGLPLHKPEFSYEDRLQRLEKRLLETERHLSEMKISKTQISELNTSPLLDRIRHKLRGDVRVAFFASLSSPVQGLASGQALIFNDVTLNLMAGYSATTGVYTCPRAGYYILSLALLPNSNEALQAQIVIDDKPLAGIASTRTEGVTMGTQGSTTALTHCNIGQQIWVKMVGGATVYGEATSHLTQFSGFLIWED